MINLPEYLFSKIYRKCDLRTQRSIYRAYKNEECPGLDRVLTHKEAQSCFICQLDIFCRWFWRCGGTKNFRGHQVSAMFSKQPSVLTEGLEVLYKLQYEDDEKKYYVQRCLWSHDDMKDADEKFLQFQEEISNVFKACTKQEMKAHLRSVHKKNNYFPKEVHDMIRKPVGKLSSFFKATT